MDQRDAAGDVDALQSAIAHHEAGRLAEAEALYLDILQDRPDEPDALNLLGVILQERGELDRSIELISRAVQCDPDFPEALANLARAQHAAGQLQAAMENAARAEALDPELAAAPLILCRVLLDLGDAARAADAGRRAAALAPGFHDAHAYLGMALEALKDWQGAASAYQASLDLQPSNVAMRIRLAAMLAMTGEHERAIGHLREAVEHAPNDAAAHSGLAFALRQRRDIAGSLMACGRALELAPARADLWRLQGYNSRALGRFDDAVECYRRLLELEPGSPEALGELARLGRLTGDAPEIARLSALLSDDAAPFLDRLHAGFGLGSLYDRIGAYDEAFAHFKTANDLARAYHASRNELVDAEASRATVDAWISRFARAALTRVDTIGDPSELPVFVVGMARSGTTLVEQIAASHRRVHGAGERKDIASIVARLEKQHPGSDPTLWHPSAVRREAEAHIANLRALAGDADRVIDKLPDNVLFLAHIAILFPRARVIVCRRDPRDTCLSCYFQLFSDPTVWSLDLADCAARAREIERLLAHWRSNLPLRMLEVQYETLIADPEGQSRRLIEFLGLEWDPACLEFHKTERAVLTASAWQVRQPLYNSSIGRWRHYRRHLQPLFDGLKELLPMEGFEIRHGYNFDTMGRQYG